MANETNGRKKKVTRQSWKPNRALTVLHGLWVALYSVLKIVMGALITVFVIAGICVVVFVGTLGDYLENDVLPDAVVDLDSFAAGQNSIMYYIDENGDPQVLQKLYANVNTERATYEEIPQAMINAAVAIEDKRFFEHQGVDWFTTIKACLNMFLGGDQFGGSSLTQQLIKNLFEEDDVTVQRKVQEIFRATQFEKRYDKTVVLTWYLNEIYLGNRINGVKAAASYYFGKELEHLTPAECACIISITNNPSLFDPTSTKVFEYDGKMLDGYERNKIRKENTLWMMRNQGYLTEEEYQEALAQELVFKNGIDPEDKIAKCNNEECGYRDKVGTYELKNDKYYCPQCGNETPIGEDASQVVYSWFVDEVLDELGAVFAARYGRDWETLDREERNFYKDMVCSGGYHIYTTLDMRVQNAVDRIYQDLDEIPKAASLQQLQSGIIVINNDTGDIIAMAGGVGNEKGFDDYNRATDAHLQPGSSIKPLSVYGPAFELGIISPATVVEDMPLYYTGDRPYPYNADRTYSYSSTIYSAITRSINTASVRVLDNMGLKYGLTFARDKFGLSELVEEYYDSSGNFYSDLGYSPLGMGAPTIGVTVRQMANAFATFPNDGVYRTGRTYTKVYNNKGEVVVENEQESRTIISEKTVQYMNLCLYNAVESGTGTAAQIDGQYVYGKTGTTSSRKDRWFCGYTEYYTAAIWVGYDYPEIISLVGSSKNPACRLFNKVMEPLHEDLEAVKLLDESKFEYIDVCEDCGKLATDACNLDPRYHDSDVSRVSRICVYPEDIPVESCDCHVVIDFCTECNAVASEYCKMFAAIGRTSLVKRSLVKMTQAEVDAIAAADDNGLYSKYCADNFIYLVDNAGNPLYAYKGIHGDKNAAVYAPYLVCTVHTKESWNAYMGN